MRKITSTIVLLLATILVGCGGDSPESIMKEIVANMNTMAEIFEGVKDEASAKAALPKIEEVRKKMRDVASRAKNVKTNPAGEKALQESMGKEMTGVMTRLMTARGTLEAKPELLKILEPALQGMENDM